MTAPPSFSASLRRLELSLKHSYYKLSERDQRALKLMGYLFLGMLFYQFIWLDLHQWHDNERYTIEKIQQQHDWLSQNQEMLMENSHTQQPADAEGGSPLTIATKIAKEFQLTMTNFSPDSQGQLTITFNNARFNDLLLWIDTLESNYGLQMRDLTIIKSTQPGMVNAQITLSTEGY